MLSLFKLMFSLNSSQRGESIAAPAARVGRASRWAAAVLALTALLGAGTAQAIATYTYVGNNFDEIRTTPSVIGTYTTTQSVSGSFTLGAAIGANARRFDASDLVTTFSFTDGRQTFDETTNLSRLFINVDTDAAGDIVAWRVVLQRRDIRPLDAIETVNFGITVQDLGSQQSSAIAIDRGRIRNAPGTWSVEVIPEPGTALLLGLGLAGLGSVRRR